MNRFSRFTFAALGGLGAIVAVAGIAGATTYQFTVPVTVTAAKTVTSASVECAVGGTKLTFNPGQGNIVRGTADTGLPSAAPPHGDATVQLNSVGDKGTFTGQARVTVNADAVVGQAAPTNYICFATTGTNDAYTTAPVISGTLPVIVK